MNLWYRIFEDRMKIGMLLIIVVGEFGFSIYVEEGEVSIEIYFIYKIEINIVKNRL